MEGILSVSELCQHIKLVLDSDELLRTCFVKGEISNVSLYPSGHLYFTLKDASSQIACVMFQAEERGLKFKPQDGMKLLAFGRVSIFPGRSQYQLIVHELKPEGVGELFIAFQQLKERLEKEGLFEQSRKRLVPFFPKIVGIVTSLQGAALHDMLTIVERRNSAIQVIVAPSAVQGADAPESLIKALRALQTFPGVDVIILGRGGGSPEELWAFNDENLAREIYRCRIPVISAVGHETDFTIADFVSDKRAPTPSAAAELVAPDRESLLRHLSHLYERLRLALSRKVTQEERVLQSLLKRPVIRFPFERIEKENQILDFLSQRLEALSPTAVLKRGYVLVVKNNRILKSAGEALQARKAKLIFHDGQVAAEFQKDISQANVQQSFL